VSQITRSKFGSGIRGKTRHIWPPRTLEASASEAARSRFGAGVKGKSNLYGLRKNLIRTEAIQLTPRETTEVSEGWRRRRAPRQGSSRQSSCAKRESTVYQSREVVAGRFTMFQNAAEEEAWRISTC
jgi:hypothetical protein